MFAQSINQRLIDKINYPSDLKQFDISELPQIAEELRDVTIEKVSQTGGHLGAGLGVVELTVALHYVFDTPKDQIIWDIGHQGYPHKILTGRKDLMHTIRQGGGLSGFLKRSESEYDVFGAGHSSTSLSVAHGVAISRDMIADDHHVVAIIGDGALTAGMAYEAMNNIAHHKSKMIVILNDNDMSIAKNVGAMNKYLNRLMSSKPFLTFRHLAKQFVEHMPDGLETFAKKTKKFAKDVISGGNFFEELGFHYVGPIDGHDVQLLVAILENLKNDDGISSPILIHIKTQKGKGFQSESSCKESYHAVSKFDPITKEQVKATATNPTYTKVFANTLCKIADADEKVVAITAAMPSGTGLNLFADHLPDRMIDVGIAEQHAVTFAAGMTLNGIKPFVAIYSTFLQRAYDQVIHDVVLQKLPVRFILDRAGYVGADGATHAGAFDLAYLCCLPDVIVMAPSDEEELARMVQTAYEVDDMPTFVRFPRGEGVGVTLSETPKSLELGRARVMTRGNKLAIISLGTRLAEAAKAAEELEAQGISVTLIDARFAKPFDKELVAELAQSHKMMITVEEGSVCGFGSLISQFLCDSGLMHGLQFRSLFMPDEFLDHDTQFKQYEQAGLNASGIIKAVQQMYNTAQNKQ